MWGGEVVWCGCCVQEPQQSSCLVMLCLSWGFCPLAASASLCSPVCLEQRPNVLHTELASPYARGPVALSLPQGDAPQTLHLDLGGRSGRVRESQDSADQGLIGLQQKGGQKVTRGGVSGAGVRRGIRSETEGSQREHQLHQIESSWKRVPMSSPIQGIPST